MYRFLMTLAAVVGSGLSSANAGAVGGPRIALDRVADAYGIVSYDISFYGGETASVLIEGDGDTDLDFYVYDRYGNLITSDTDGTDLCVLRFTPFWTDAFRIVIVNRGPVYNRYSLATD